MAAYRRVYDSRHLQADCQEPESAPDPRSVIEYGLPTFQCNNNDDFTVGTVSECLSYQHTATHCR